VRARGILETIHRKRLPFDDALYLSANFTYAVASCLWRHAEEGKLAVALDDEEELHFLGPDGSFKFPSQILNSLVDLIDELGKSPPDKQSQHNDAKVRQGD